MRRDASGPELWARDQIRRHDPTAVLEAARAVGQFSSTRWIGEVDVPTAVVVTTRISSSRRGVSSRWPKRSPAQPCIASTVATMPRCSAPTGFVPALLDACASVASRSGQRRPVLSPARSGPPLPPPPSRTACRAAGSCARSGRSRSRRRSRRRRPPAPARSPTRRPLRARRRSRPTRASAPPRHRAGSCPPTPRRAAARRRAARSCAARAATRAPRRRPGGRLRARTAARSPRSRRATPRGRAGPPPADPSPCAAARPSATSPRPSAKRPSPSRRTRPWASSATASRWVVARGRPTSVMSCASDRGSRSRAASTVIALSSTPTPLTLPFTSRDSSTRM